MMITCSHPQRSFLVISSNSNQCAISDICFFSTILIYSFECRMAAALDVLNYFDTPLRALSISTQAILSARLNPPKIISTDEGIPRDWRRLAELALIPSEDMPLVASRPDQTSHILEFWTNGLSGTIGDLVVGLEEMDRFDVIDDTAHMMAADARQFAADQERAATSAATTDPETENRIITYGDRIRLKNGQKPQRYDAFLLFAEADKEFADLSINILEETYNLKLCLKDRDLVAGLPFEHNAIMRLISERCTRLIVVVSPNFLESEENRFLVSFAQATGLDQRERKVVPVLYRQCELPTDLRFIHRLDFTRLSSSDFWERLKESIETLTTQYDSAASTSSNVEDSWKDLTEKDDFIVVKHSSETVAVGTKQFPGNSSNSQIYSKSGEKLDAKKSDTSKSLLDRVIGVFSKKKTKKLKPKKPKKLKLTKQKAEMA